MPRRDELPESFEPHGGPPEQGREWGEISWDDALKLAHEKLDGYYIPRTGPGGVELHVISRLAMLPDAQTLVEDIAKAARKMPGPKARPGSRMPGSRPSGRRGMGR